MRQIALSGAADTVVLGRLADHIGGSARSYQLLAPGVSGVMVWGLHRDTAELTQIALPVFSYGRCPAGPVRIDEQEPSAGGQPNRPTPSGDTCVRSAVPASSRRL
jgi:hypothetical protein